MDYKYFNELTRKQKLLLKGLSPINWLLHTFNLEIEIAPKGDANEMITLEQRINLFHLLNDVLVNEVEGDVAEFGSHVGNSALQIQSILKHANSNKIFHVYDKFDERWETQKRFTENFANFNLPLPIIHKGLFSSSIPSELPEKICFLHIDAGYGGDQVEFMDIILHLLENVYVRMSAGAICLLMDYHDKEKTIDGINSNPGVKAACDIFFEDKPESVYVLYGNRFSHGYFRKQNQTT